MSEEDGYYEGEEPHYSDPLDPRGLFYVQLPDKLRYRKLFLEAVAKEAPQVLKSLRRNCGPMSRAERLRRSNISTSIDNWGEWFWLARRDSVAGHWILEAASRTIRHWTEHPEQAEHAVLQWAPSAAEFEPDQINTYGPRDKNLSQQLREVRETPFRFEIKGYDPGSGKSLDVYLKRVELQFRTVLKDYERKIYNIFNYECLTEAPDKHEPKYFEWLVQYQILRLSYNKISNNSNTDIAHVSKSIKETAQLLFGVDWRKWMRPNARGGRPRTHFPNLDLDTDLDE